MDWSIKMNLVTVLSIYNEGKNLRKIVEQIHPYVDRILIIDGKYKDFDFFTGWGRSTDLLSIVREIEPVLNTDGYKMNKILHGKTPCREKFLHGYPCTVVEPFKPWTNEMEKRSVMFHCGTFGDWFLIIDGDERIRHPANWAALRYFLEHEVDPHTLIVGLMLYDYKTGLKYHTPKLVKYLPTAQYKGNHYTLKFWDTVEKSVQDQEGNEYEVFDYQEVLYDMVNDGSRREDIDFVEIDHLNRKKLDPKRNDLRKEYYLRARSIEEPNLYKVGENRYRRKIKRFSMEPIDEETKEAIMKEIKDWT